MIINLRYFVHCGRDMDYNVAVSHYWIILPVSIRIKLLIQLQLFRATLPMRS